MDKIQISFIFLLVSILTLSGVAYAENDVSYSMPSIHEDLFVQSNGALHVKEVIHYSFSGTAHGVYRDLQLEDGQSISNLKVSTSGAYSTYTVKDTDEGKRVTVYLYSDAQKTTPISGGDVYVTYEYDFLHGIKVYNDVADLQYKLWGEGWDVPVNQLTATVHLASTQGVKYWLNPPYSSEGSQWQGNVFNLTTTELEPGDFFEVRMTIPRGQFAANPQNAVVINQNGLQEIEKIQNDYQNSLNLHNNLNYFLVALLVLLMFVPLIIYLKFGREPEIDYRAEYERDVPTDDPPALVNAICVHGVSKGIGEPDMDGFRATIMDLINRNYLSVGRMSKDDGSFKDDFMGTYLKVNPEKDSSKLEKFELDALDILKSFEREGIIVLEDMGSELEDPDTAKDFRFSYMKWETDLKKRFLTDGQMEEIFNRKGDNYLKAYAVGGLILACVVGVYTFVDFIPTSRYPLYAAIVLGIISAISLKLPEGIAGQWTTYGEEYDAKWSNFKRYLKDFSLIKEYPPESVAVWNKYLVYATALGVADKVRKAMEMNLPGEVLEDNNIYLFHYYGGYMLLDSALNMGMTSGLNSDVNGVDGLGGFGDVGGGFGGGGGGAF